MARNVFYKMLNSERDVADYVCKTFVEDIVNENNGLTLGGIAIADKLTEKWNTEYVPNNISIHVATTAVRNWLVCAGYDNEGRFTYELSNYRL